MAVSSKESEANIQELINRGVPQNMITGYGNKLNQNEMNRIWSSFQAQPQNVFTTSNINQASVSPQVAPDDLLGIRDQINRQLGIPELQAQYQDIFGQLKEFDVATQAQSQKLQEQPLVMSQIRGQQAQVAAQRAQERLGLATEAEVAYAALIAAQQEAREQFGIREGDIRARQQLIISNPGAGITFGDSIEEASQKIASYNKKQEEEAREQAKKDAFDKLYMSVFGTDRGKLSRREAQKKLKKRFDSDREYEEALREMELANTRSLIAERGRSSVDDLDLSNKGLSGMIDEEINAGTDWGTIAAKLEAANISTEPGSAADRYLRYKFLGEQNPFDDEDGGVKVY